MRHFIVLFLALIFFSCQSYRIVQVETYNPATITFPQDIRTIMIVNNAAQQPDDFGHQFIYYQKIDSTLSVSADSMAYHFCRSLGKEIAESPFFDDVRLCEDTLRHDSNFYNSQPLSVDKVKWFCDAYDVDALITLDKFFLKTILFDSDRFDYNNRNYIKVELFGELKALWPGGNVALTIPFTDSLVWTMDYFTPFEAFTIQEIPYAMRYLSEHTGSKMHIHFVPYWSADKRWYYTQISSDWKRATAFAFAEKWESAANIWKPLYDKTTQKKQKACLASNLALAYELAGDFTQALEYAEKAYTFFSEIADEDDHLRKMQQSYLELLKVRIEDNRKLSEQLQEMNNEQ